MPNRTMMVRTAVASGAALICAGMAGPALADTPTGGTSPPTSPPTHHMLTLAQQQSYIDAFVNARSSWLSSLSQKVADSTTLSADRKVAIQASITKEQAALATLKSSVDSATTESQVRSALQTWWMTHPHVPWWGNGYGHAGRDDGAVRQGEHASFAGHRTFP